MSDRFAEAFAEIDAALDQLDGSLSNLGRSLDRLESGINSMASRAIVWALATGFAMLVILIVALHFAASAIEPRRATTVQQGVVHESAVGEAETPEHRSSHHPRDPDNG